MSLFANPMIADDPPLFDGGEQTYGNWNGWLTVHARGFNQGVSDLKGELAKALEVLHGNPADPEALVKYQSALQEYNMYRMAQSNSSKNLADLVKGNVRNLT
ncbi:MAG TPA: EscF/YscF/HrpA family type III secretion system needle major subunit [Dyella sp.]|uniref:EscF/YscF/HrpA family type III secretion system needle major subunit n=1 Tax=Dyella sp. TaxID=1869338 RepID=UPI002F92435B